MNLPKGVVLLDSLGDLQPNNTSPILVCGSHCGGNRALAAQVKRCHVKAAFLNNAGVGKKQAGTRGLAHYEAEHVIACAVSHDSAEIGVARDTWECGIISHINTLAQKSGIQVGEPVQQAISKLLDTLEIDVESQESNSAQDKGSEKALKQLEKMLVNGIAITVTDSITFLSETNAGDIVVCGSHGGVSAGHYAQKHAVRAVFFNDAGIGKNNAGTKSLETLSDAGILACTVNCFSAEIFNGHDALENGILSVCNALAKSKGIHEKMSVKDALGLI